MMSAIFSMSSLFMSVICLITCLRSSSSETNSPSYGPIGVILKYSNWIGVFDVIFFTGLGFFLSLFVFEGISAYGTSCRYKDLFKTWLPGNHHQDNRRDHACPVSVVCQNSVCNQLLFPPHLSVLCDVCASEPNIFLSQFPIASSLR